MSGTEHPRPDLDGPGAPFWEGAQAGELRIMRCDDCGNAFLPAREECPGCLSASVKWVAARGTGRLVSWIEYHRAFHPAFKDKVPYTVALVELDEGARIISNITGAIGTASLSIGMPVRLAVEAEGDLSIPRFRPVES